MIPKGDTALQKYSRNNLEAEPQFYTTGAEGGMKMTVRLAP